MSNPVIGQTIIARVTFRDTDGDLVAPSAITLTVHAPDDTTTTHSIGDLDNPSLGVYQLEIVLDQAGVWDWRFVGTTSQGDAVCEDSICADASILVSA